jgi:ADP-heptose:LPS heptosyltransferase
VWQKWLRWRSRSRAKRVGVDRLRQRGDRLRGAGRHYDAGVLYAAAVDLHPDPHLRIQAGHMFKEAGDLPAAEEQYFAAAAELPDDADLALQLGHFSKVAGRLGEAVGWYRRACALKPDWADPLRELNRLGALHDDAGRQPPGAGALTLDRRATRFAEPLDVVVLRHFGGLPLWNEPRGVTVLRGVEAIRGICISTTELNRAELLVDGSLVADAPLSMVDETDVGTRKFVFNIWFDFGAIKRETHRIDVRLVGEDGQERRAWRDAFVGAPLVEADYPDSDAVVNGPGVSDCRLDDWLHRRPSMVRPARARFLSSSPRCILVIRADQLGDMVVSVPALRRLRALAPQARIVGLVTPANVDLAHSLNLFDAVETMTWDAAAPAGQRWITAAEQERVAAVLRSYQPDVAIDLLVSGASRPLLALSGAACTVGFEDEAWPWLTIGLSGHSHDVRTRHEIAPHAARLLTLVERFGTLLDSGSATVAPNEPQCERLAAFGVRRRGYAVLHSGGRYAFSRWAGYGELVQRLLAATDLDLIVFGERDGLPGPVVANSRVQVVDRELAFADFDALLGHAAVFVGNDSGPKHLASLRGTPVVSVHSSRVDWREWGQTQTGLIVSRRLPCAGCSLHADQEAECGRDFACIADIRVDEVFAAVSSLL